MTVSSASTTSVPSNRFGESYKGFLKYNGMLPQPPKVFLIGFIFTMLSVAGFCAFSLMLDYRAQKAYETAIFTELKKTKSTTTTRAESTTEKQTEETVSSAPPVFNDPPEIDLIGHYGLLSVSYKGFLVINVGYESPKPPKNISMATYLYAIRKRSANFVNSSLVKNTGQDYDRIPTDIYDSGKAYVFLNIPFAKAPVGERAMSAPEPMPAADFKKFIEKERDHTNFGPFCPQILGVKNRRSFYYNILSVKMNLDNCLSLNIYMPADDAVNASYPVHVAIFGGMLTEGSAIDYGIRGIVQAFVSENIVVVTLNYRLGAYGFLKMDKKSYNRGNSVRGLYDQVMALKWVNQHIADFKGDPNRVTIGGFSAGACSASTLALATISNAEIGKLFNQVILESGSLVLCSPEGPLKRNASTKLSEKLCQGNNASCFNNLKKSGNESVLVPPIEEVPLGMDIELPDKPLFPQPFHQMINSIRHKTKEFPPLRFYMGVNRDEFSLFDESIRKIINYEGPYGQAYVRNIAEMNFKPSGFEKVGKILFDLTQHGVENDFLNYYINRHHNPDDEEYQYYHSMEALSGITFFAFTMFDACLFARRSSVYLYKFYHRSRMFRNYGLLDKYNLAPHGADFFFAYQPEYLWQLFDFQDSKEMVLELKVARSIQRSYAEFIRGAPIMIHSIKKPLGSVYVGESAMQNVTPHIIFDTDGVKWDTNNFIHPTVQELVMQYVTNDI